MLHEVDVRVIEDAVHRVHRIVILGTELANLLLRHWLKRKEASKLAQLFNSNFLCKLLNVVSASRRKEKRYERMDDVYSLLEEDMCLTGAPGAFCNSVLQ